MKKKIGVLGHFGFGQKKLNGQTIKTLSVSHILSQTFGKENVLCKDTSGGAKNFFSILKNVYSLQKKCEHKVLLVAQNGIRVGISRDRAA